ncbi:probable phospholipid-transporting ATPase IA isoform X2 [Halichondria panicea]|uniref:probable phospholipid-transporting ATPase IA isoform X2 n=1 Tax=Halichondria panicea TaxID=6063 RepID=UPI00312B4BBB
MATEKDTSPLIELGHPVESGFINTPQYTDESSTASETPLTSAGSKKYGTQGPSSPQRHGGIRNWKDYLNYWRNQLQGQGKFQWPWKRNKPPARQRTIYFNDREKNKSGVKYCSNQISTTKYNILTFIPKFLFDQFGRYANLFFLVIALLQQIPGISPTGRYTTIVPLTMVLLVIAVKEIIEDMRRWRADNKVNNSKTGVLRNDMFETLHWKKLVVGDIVRVENGQFFPADLVLLSSSEPQGICYVETSNLDGETNLKIRQAHTATVGRKTERDLAVVEGLVECEGPNNRLYEFTGNINLSEQLEPIQADQVLLRGSQLRNTDWVAGLVIYTGHESKLLQNATSAPLKRSRMDQVTNRQVIFLVCILVSLSILSSIGMAIWNSIHVGVQDHWYLDISLVDAAGQFFLSILTFVILYNNLIPISLIVTLEVLKFVQSFYINWDLDMYNVSNDTPALVRNSNLNEELGQVKYVFSDKTGTLTENIMEFKKCSVAGEMYSMDTTDGSSQRLVDALQGLSAASDSTVLEFLKVLALCHTVIPEAENGEIKLRASSPDEEALVMAAIKLGVQFRERTPSSVIIDVFGTNEKYEVLNLLEFNSDRKRMSVIVRCPDGTIKLLCKGADSVVYSRLAPRDTIKSTTENHLNLFAEDGLRTLCIAQAVIDKEAYEAWNREYHVASTALENREKKLDECAETIEKNLCLLGATAVEDKLQEGVPESIATLRSAGIKVWVLTGDKQETAINIGVSSRQLTSKMNIIIINYKSLKEVKDHLLREAESSSGKENALVIDGKSLMFALDPSAKDLFLRVALKCKSVICCRVSPLQKADVVRLVRSKVKDSITLAIGDGANDVSMIQAAHVGVGISGREGLQATLASDYAIAQFRFLLKLLLVHGVWNYNRLAKVILYSFYKNICLYIIEFWFAFFNGFSGQPIFERWTIALFNVLFTFLPTLTFGLYEQDTTARARMEVPSLYIASQEGKYFNTKVFWKWVGLAIFHSLFLFFFVYFMLLQEALLSNGEVVGIWYVGNTIYTCVVITVNLKLALESRYWTWLHHVAVWGSILIWYLFLAIYPHFWPRINIGSDMVGQDAKLYGSAMFYFLPLLAPVVAMLPDFLWTVWKQNVNRSHVEKVRQEEKDLNISSKGAYQKFSHVSVSYSPRSTPEYGDGLEGGRTKSIEYILPSHGYAFSQEDHGITRKGSRLQRRDMIKMAFYGPSP